MKKQDWYFSALMFAGFMFYFYLMKILGLHTNLNLRVFNLVIHFSVVYLAMKVYRQRHSTEPFSFADVSLAGIRAALPAVIAFALFQFINLRFLDPGFMDYVKAHAPLGDYMYPALASLTLMGEGLVATGFSAYVGMRLIAAQEHQEFHSW